MFSTTLAVLARGGADGSRGAGGLIALLLIALIIGAVVVRRRSRPRNAEAMTTLRERFARGDIDQADFEHRQAVLTGSDVIPPAPPTPAPVDDSSAASPGTSSPDSETDEQ